MLSDKASAKGCVLYDGTRVACCVKPVKRSPMKDRRGRTVSILASTVK